ncbi:MAG TPA: hypothetical protein VN200_00030 [Rhodoglobus sp.]|nr:hypothetical protein [Rhodoglobus sp.]
MTKLPLPNPAPTVFPFRTVDRDRVAITEFPGRRLRITIDHEPLAGVTPDMLLWWFSNIGGDMAYAGASYTRYTVWHPLDHIHWALARQAPGGGAAEGARFRIVEAMGRDERYRVDGVDRVEKLDRTGIRLVQRVAGGMVFQLEHTWSEGRGRTHYVSVLDLGGRSALARPLNAYLRSRVFTPGIEQAWVRHNVEEVGRLEHFLPGLYEQHTRSAQRPVGLGPERL